jgi:zinc protease
MAQKPADVAGTFFVREQGGIREYRLGKNDLQILLVPDSSVPVAGCMVTYRVGSRNEAVGHTGSTHLLEHLMFKGSENFNKETNTTIWNILETKGALVNATTWLDRTNYFEVVPKEHLPVAIRLEADRMRTARIDETDRQSEMTVVRNEFERGENDPREALDKQIWATAYGAHPYHHPTIGWRSDIEGVSIERLKLFYDEFYWPNNATVTIVGDFNEVDVLGLIAKEFGRHTRSPQPIPEVHTVEPPQEGERRVVVERAQEVQLVGIAHKMPEAAHVDMPALIIAALVLGEGKTSRLHRSLVNMAKLSDCSVWAYPFHDPSLFMTYATLTDDVTHTEIEVLIKAEYAKLTKNPPSAAEMKTAKRLYRSALASRRDGPYALLSSLNEDIARGDWRLFFSFPEEIEKVTANDVARVVKQYLLPNSQSVVGYFIGTNKPLKVVKKVVSKPKKKLKAKKRPTFNMRKKPVAAKKVMKKKTVSKGKKVAKKRK